MSTSKPLLTSVQVARFVAQGFLRLDGVVPQEINERAIAALTEGLPKVSYGTALGGAFAPDTFVHELLTLPVVAGAVESLVGPEPPSTTMRCMYVSRTRGRRSRSTAMRSSTYGRTRSTSSSCTTRTR